MSDSKKLILGFSLKEGRAYSWDGAKEYGRPLTELAGIGCDHGADQVILFDRSESEADHEAVIRMIKEAARTVDEPILAGGRVKRLEDVKKYLYAGAGAVFLDVGCEENVDLMKEAADRFGSEKIYAFLPDVSYIPRTEEYAQLGASVMILGTASRSPSLSELGEIGESGQESLIFSGEYPSAGGMAGELKIHLGCPLVRGAILTLDEESMDTCMEIKQMLKASGISTDTFESAVDFKEFKLDSQGLIPVIVQDYKSSRVLMLAYMNEESYEATLSSGTMTYYSRSRGELWKKGGTSGHLQYVKSLKLDCDKDTVLASVKQVGAACHTGSSTCFFTTLAEKKYRETNPLKVFEDVYGIILDRKEHPKEGSYTNYLFDKGIDKILKKLGEEATEIIIAAKNPDAEEVKYEISDFLYHMMVLMAQKGVTWEEITKELANR